MEASCVDKHPHTRGAQVFCEQIMDELALELNMSGIDLRRANFYREGDKTHFSQLIEPGTWHVPR
jgi:CO/xanthine dehydrogenase Mo-binding subunit